jgi:hypothetical protein
LNAKADLASPTFTGTVTLPAGQVVNGVTLASGGSATLFLNQAGGYSAPSGGGATITLSAAAFEHQQTITATGVTGSNRINVWLDPATDDDENVPEMLDLVTLAAAPGTDQITVTATFATPTSGPVKIQWSAF